METETNDAKVEKNNKENLKEQGEPSQHDANANSTPGDEKERPEWEELLGKDILLKVINPGNGDMAEVNHLVRISYIGRVTTPGEEGVFEIDPDTGFRIGDSDTTPGLELGIRHFRKGMKGIIKVSSKYGYGPFGRLKISGKNVEKITCHVPPNADIEYEVTCIDIYPPFNHAEASLEQKLFECSLKKLHGNDFSFHEDWNRALRCYSAGVKALNPGEQNSEEDADDLSEDEEEMDYKEMEEVDDEDNNSEDEKNNENKNLSVAEKRRMKRKAAKEHRKAHRAQLMEKVWKLFIDIHNNMALCLHQLGKYKDVKQAVMKILEVDPNNVKALYRGGMAALMLSDFEEAKLALEEALKLMPDDPLIKRGYAEYQKKYTAYLKKDREITKGINAGVWKSRPEKTNGSNQLQTNQVDESFVSSNIKETDIKSNSSEIKEDKSMKISNETITFENDSKEEKLEDEKVNESSKSGTLEKRETTQDLKGDGKKKSQSNLKTIRLWIFVIICFLIPLVTSWNSIVFYFNHKYGKLSFASHTNGDSSSFLSTSSESDSL